MQIKMNCVYFPTQSNSNVKTEKIEEEAQEASGKTAHAPLIANPLPTKV
jgi:hypothetical protein